MQLSGSSLEPPRPDQVELTLFGPGYGECIVAHLGAGRWAIVDSFISPQSKEPVALEYLTALGVDPSSGVKLIVATHWHDDHCRGLGKVFGVCRASKFVIAGALRQEEFLRVVKRYQSRPTAKVGSKVKEISTVFDTLESEGQHRPVPRFASQDKILFTLPSAESGHGHECQVTALSPSDKATLNFLRNIGSLIPELRTTKHPANDPTPNQVSVVLWIRVGNVAILLGADLENASDLDMGWSVIVASQDRPLGKAQVFKVPHHGSSNAHDDHVWSELLLTQPIAILAPFSRGRTVLPTRSDVHRICGRAHASFSSAKVRFRKPEQRPSAVTRQLREMGVTVRRVNTGFGVVRLRTGPESGFSIWCVELFNDACPLLEAVA